MLQSFLNSKKVTAFPCGASAGTRERLGSSELFSLSLPHAEIRPLDRPDFFRAQKDMDVEAVLSRAAVLLAKKRAELAGRDDITPSELRHAARDIPVNPPWSTAAVILAGFEAEKAGKKYVSSSDISKAAEKITCPLKEAAPTVLLAVVRAELSGAETADLDAAYADVPKDDPNAAAAVLLAVERAKASKNSEISKRDIDAALRDAWAFTFMRLPVNLLGCVFVAIIVGASIGLIAGLGQSFAVIVWALLFFFGFYAVTGIFTVFAHASFDKMVTEGLLDRENRAAAREAYAAIRAKKAAGLVPAKKKQEPAKFVNPKKKKKSESTDKATVHENMTPSPAPAAKKIKGGYTAADLERLEADRAKVKAEAENNASSDDIEDMSVYEDDGE